jgi:uncharacterized phage protein (TIGR01671 family)
MDNIKLRGWNPKTKKMLYNFNDCAMGWGADGSLNIAEYMEYGTHEELIDLILLQYTGITDKHGEMIWEGDIISEGIYEPPMVYCGDDVSVVVYRFTAFRKMDIRDYPKMDVKGQFGEVRQGIVLQSYGGVLDNLSHIEVIGNIYENPELLSNV